MERSQRGQSATLRATTKTDDSEERPVQQIACRMCTKSYAGLWLAPTPTSGGSSPGWLTRLLAGAPWRTCQPTKVDEGRRQRGVAGFEQQTVVADRIRVGCPRPQQKRWVCTSAMAFAAAAMPLVAASEWNTSLLMTGCLGNWGGVNLGVALKTWLCLDEVTNQEDNAGRILKF